MIKVLVILAYYNGEDHIDEQISTILGQVDVEIDLIIFDDFSVNPSVLKKFNDPRIEVVRRLSNSGSAANNFCLSLIDLVDSRLAKYDYVALADQDDIWMPAKISHAVRILRLKNAVVYFSDLYVWSSGNNHQVNYLKKSYPQKDFDHLFESGSAGCTCVFTTDFCLDFKRFLCSNDLSFWKVQGSGKPYFSHDWLIYFYAREFSQKVCIDPNAHLLYRIHSANVHGTLNLKTLKAAISKLQLVIRGWYFHQSSSFMKILDKDSESYTILKLYNFNWFSRIFVVFKYNFSLMRSRRKFIRFIFVSLLPRFY